MAKQSWGYNQQEVLYVAVPDQAAFEKLNVLVMQDPNVVSISGSHHHLGKTHTTTIIHMPDRQFEVDQLSVDANYFETMGLQLAAGRVYQDYAESDKKRVVVNESFISSMAIGMESSTFAPILIGAKVGWPIGQVFKIDSVQHEIIGVVKDFHMYSFFKKVNPTIFKVADKENYRYLSIKVRPGSEHETSKAVQARWAELYPEIPFDGGFQEDVWGDYFEQLNIHRRVWKGFAIIAVVLASLGLYGLITLNVAGRVKEFSIRKILGAGIRSIASNITSQYVVLFAAALTIGAPVSYILNKMLFDTIYWYHMPITYGGVVIAAGILILVLLTTVSTQVRKVLKSNPVNGLKVE